MWHCSPSERSHSLTQVVPDACTTTPERAVAPFVFYAGSSPRRARRHLLAGVGENAAHAANAPAAGRPPACGVIYIFHSIPFRSIPLHYLQPVDLLRGEAVRAGAALVAPLAVAPAAQRAAQRVEHELELVDRCRVM